MGEIVFVGDSLALTAEVRPVVGATFDFWGSGGCRTLYGAPMAAVIEWASSKADIATVSNAGVVRGLQAGEAIITAKVKDPTLEGRRKIEVRVRSAGPS